MVLLGAALSTLHRDGRIAWLWVTQQDMVQSEAAEEDCEGIVNYAIAIAGVEVAVLLRELPDDCVRLSIRSKGKVNVAHIAEGFGGGGHANASGCTLPGPLEDAAHSIVENPAKLAITYRSIGQAPAERRLSVSLEFDSGCLLSNSFADLNVQSGTDPSPWIHHARSKLANHKLS